MVAGRAPRESGDIPSILRRRDMTQCDLVIEQMLFHSRSLAKISVACKSFYEHLYLCVVLYWHFMRVSCSVNTCIWV